MIAQPINLASSSLAASNHLMDDPAAPLPLVHPPNGTQSSFQTKGALDEPTFPSPTILLLGILSLAIASPFNRDPKLTHLLSPF